MNKLLSTTALVVALGFPTLVFAQTAEPAEDNAATAATEQDAGQQDTNMSGFLSERGQSDLFASELIGRDVHARKASGETETTDDQAAENSDDQATGNADGTHDMATMNRGDLDDMDNIGQINEIVLSKDGQVRALVIGVGGFLGMGEQDVAVSMDQISIMSDADDQSEMHVVLNTESETLKDAPAYDRSSEGADAAESGDDTDRTAEGTDAAEGGDEADGAMVTTNAESDDEADRTAEGTDAAEGDDRTEDRSAFAAPEMEREGYERVQAGDISTDMLSGKTVYDTSDEDVGTVTDMLLDGDGKITNVIIDFGGFLGIGSSQASLEYSELTILSDEGYEDVRIYVDATKEQIQDLPRYMASN